MGLEPHGSHEGPSVSSAQALPAPELVPSNRDD